MLKKLFILFISILLCSTLIMIIGCGGGGEPTQTDDEYVEEVQDDGESESETAITGENTVTMNGRSVMEGWMSHWGYDWEGPVTENGYTLDYKELDADLSNIANSFQENVENLPEESVVFFKFCFDDFYGDNLSQLEGIIDDVVQVAEVGNLKLIIGNALPKHAEDSSSELVDEYESYNSYLEEIASNHDSVWIFDFYGVLAGGNGYLKDEYDVGDSHLTEEAYEALDPGFFDLLNSI